MKEKTDLRVIKTKKILFNYIDIIDFHQNH